MNEENAIITSNFKIEKNTISFNDSLLQISNISHITVEPIPKPSFQLWSILVCIVGLFVMFGFEEEIKILGFLIFVAPMIYIVWYCVNYRDSEERYLCIYLNSGHVYYIYCESKKFLRRVMRVIKRSINDHTTQKITIDFNQCTLENLPINVGNEKEVINTITVGNNSDVQVNAIIRDWTLVQDELKKACANLPKTSKEYMASEEALACALDEDEERLFKVFNKYSDSFLSSVFKGVVSGVLVEIIKFVLL